MPAQRILELRVKSTLTGDNFRMVLNDGFTAIIGGRGSGKTAVLEYLRFGLARSTADTEGQPSLDRERELIQTTLKGSHVTILLERHGVLESWHRSGDRPDAITVNVAGGNSENITVQAAQQRFRARAFAQKQLSTLVRAKEDAAEQITGIAAAEEVDARRELDQRITKAKRDISAALQRVVEHWIAEAQRNDAASAVTDLRRRIEATKKRLQDSGLSPEDQQVLAEQPKYSSTASLLGEYEGLLESDLAEFQRLRNSVLSVEPQEEAVDFDELMTFASELNRTKAVVQEKLDEAINAIRSLETTRAESAASFERRQSEFQKKYSAAAAQQAALSDLISESEKLVIQLKDAESRERKTSQLLRSLTNAPSQLVEVRKALSDRLLERRTLLEAAARKVSNVSKLLRATVQTEPVPPEYVAALVAICENQRVRDLHMRCTDSRVTRRRFTRRSRIGSNLTSANPPFVAQQRRAKGWNTRCVGGVPTPAQEGRATRPDPCSEFGTNLRDDAPRSAHPITLRRMQLKDLDQEAHNALYRMSG